MKKLLLSLLYFVSLFSMQDSPTQKMSVQNDTGRDCGFSYMVSGGRYASMVRFTNGKTLTLSEHKPGARITITILGKKDCTYPLLGPKTSFKLSELREEITV